MNTTDKTSCTSDSLPKLCLKPFDKDVCPSGWTKQTGRSSWSTFKSKSTVARCSKGICGNDCFTSKEHHKAIGFFWKCWEHLMNHSVVSHPFPLIIFYISHIFFPFTHRHSTGNAGFQEPQRSWHRTWKPAMPRSLQGCPVWVARWFGPASHPSKDTLRALLIFVGGHLLWGWISIIRLPLVGSVSQFRLPRFQLFLRSTHDILVVSSYLWSSDVKLNCFHNYIYWIYCTCPFNPHLFCS